MGEFMPEEIVRGEGHAPGQGLGEEMPSIKPTTERASLSDFARIMREKNEGKPTTFDPNAARTPREGAPKQPETASSRMGKFQDALDAKQNPERAEKPEAAPAEQTVESDEPEQQGQVEELEQEPQTAVGLDDQAALTKFREWEQSDLFPEELADRLHELTMNGRTEYVDTKELRRGYQRGSESRRVWAEAQQLQAQAQTNEQHQQRFFEAIKDPGQMLSILERNGYGDTLEQVAFMIAERLDGDRTIIRAAADAMVARLGLPAGSYEHRDVAETIKRTEARLKSTRAAELREQQIAHREAMQAEREKAAEQQKNTAEWSQVYERQLNQLRPLALRAYGIKENKANNDAFKRHLLAVVTQANAENITRDLCLEAAKDLYEELQDARTSGQGETRPEALSPQAWAAQRAQRRPKPLPATRMGGGAGKPNGGLGGVKRGSLSDLEAMVARSRAGQ